ncbi:hypothetical protein MUK42_25157 [Musa troglodytarum]|uniref:1-(5-phosphoribosyl)-5-[(5-phosphoribosylamino)methylideneamino]imidazole-4-carboxamideisomerase n=2 Tax=Musa troglodytarum TaxID=320322 RepID=A0A9E7I952_9LILI|nr:hypothetical protein MUK42_25157 [Musa troglodytarum]
MPLTTRTLPSLRWSPSTPIPLRNPLSSSHPASHWRMGRKHSKPRPISCTVRFRPCIDIHKGKVKQIVGSTLRDSTDGGASALVTNFESDKSPAEFANLYKKDGLKGGHVIMLGADAASQSAAFEALRAYPGGMQVGGGINADNAMNYLEEGASHVIVTSYIFSNGKMDLERLKHLVKMIGKNRLVLDLSCRKKDGKYAIVTDRWQKFSDVILDKETLEFLAKYSDEFLIHGVDVEGKRLRLAKARLNYMWGKRVGQTMVYVAFMAGSFNDGAMSLSAKTSGIILPLSPYLSQRVYYCVIMAGMLPGVECARRRGFHLGGPVDSSTSSRRSSFCLYRTGHETHLSSSSTKRSTLSREIHGEELGHVAREAKERLDARLQIKRHNSLGSVKQTKNEGCGQGHKHRILGYVQREVFSSKKCSRKFSWSKLGWRSSEQADCAVCLEEFETGDILVHLPCDHRFHWDCVLPWLESSSHCPFHLDIRHLFSSPHGFADQELRYNLQVGAPVTPLSLVAILSQNITETCFSTISSEHASGASTWVSDVKEILINVSIYHQFKLGQCMPGLGLTYLIAFFCGQFVGVQSNALF